MSEGRSLVDYKALMAQQALAYAEQEALQGGRFFSVRGGTLKLGEEVMLGNQLCAIVLDAVKENTFYEGSYDADQASAPKCYAFGRGNDAMSPDPSMAKHPEYFAPQSYECNGCPHNEWGSAEKGKGKRCQNRRRLALIPAGVYSPRPGSRDFDLGYMTDPKHYSSTDVVYLKLPVGSVKNWSQFVTQISAQFQLPPHGVIVRVFVEPDPKYQYAVHFEMLEKVSDDLLQIIMARHEEAAKSVISGYSPPEERPATPQGSLAGLRRR